MQSRRLGPLTVQNKNIPPRQLATQRGTSLNLRQRRIWMRERKQCFSCCMSTWWPFQPFSVLTGNDSGWLNFLDPENYSEESWEQPSPLGTLSDLVLEKIQASADLNIIHSLCKTWRQWVANVTLICSPNKVKLFELLSKFLTCVIEVGLLLKHAWSKSRPFQNHLLCSKPKTNDWWRIGAINRPHL